MLVNEQLVSYIGEPVDNTAMYIAKKVEHLLDKLTTVTDCTVFCEDTIEVPDGLKGKHHFIMTPNPHLEYIKYVTVLADKIEAKNRQRQYSLTQGGYYIGENVTIGEGSYIEPLCLIGHDVIIGKNAVVRTGAKIKNAVIGDNLIANENAAIGMNGFNFCNDENGNQLRIPSLGKVIIGNYVEVGALTNISVGSAGNTVIGDYVKIDCLAHISHDVKVGKNAELCAGAITGGFDQINDNVFIGGNAVFRNRITVGDDSFISMGSVIVKSVDDGANVFGNPAREFKR